MKVRIKPLFYFIVIVMLLLQEILQRQIGIIQYLDEIVGICMFIYLIIYIFKKQTEKRIINSLIIVLILLLIGLYSNYKFGIQSNTFAIFTDIINHFKGYLSFFGFYLLFNNMNNDDKRLLINYLTKFCIIVIIPGFILAILNLFIDTHMSLSSEYAFGLRGFHYIFIRAGILRSFCIKTLIILTLSTFDDNNKKNKKYIFMTLVVLLLTLKARSLITAFIFAIGYLFFIKEKKIRINKVYLALIGLISYYIALPKIQFYFTNENRARNVLLKYGIETAKKYFPIGSGFGTYGTFAAKKYWSVLYNLYHFNNYYGLSEDWGAFLTDNYWPAIMGEFGFIGILLFAILIYNIFRIIIYNTKESSVSKFAALFGLTVIIIESFASASFFSSGAVLTMIIIAIATVYKKENDYENINSSTNSK